MYTAIRLDMSLHTIWGNEKQRLAITPCYNCKRLSGEVIIIG